MSHFQFRFIYFFCSLNIFLLISCSTGEDDIFLSSQNQNVINIDQEINSLSLSDESLLIETVPFSDNMFHFPNLETFHKVKIELSDNITKYENYFIERNLNFSSFDKVYALESEYNEEMTQSEVYQLLADHHHVVPNEFNEIDYKFPMLYQNLFLNIDGLVEIGHKIVLYDINDKKIFNSIEHYESYLDNSAKPLDVITYQHYSNIERSFNSDCTCRSDFDAGTWCGPRRIRGTLDIQFDGYSNLFGNGMGCSVDYDVDAESTWYKRRLGIWWRNKADTLNVEVEASIFNKRGSGGILYNTCSFSDFKGNSNVNRVTIASFIGCSDFKSGDGPCRDERDEDNHGIRSGDSRHWGMEGGNCGGTAQCNNTGCI